MEKQEYAVGLDIGTTKIVAMIGRKNEYGKIELLGTGKAKSLGVQRGVVNNITQTIQSIQQAVDEAIAVSVVQISDAIVGIAGHIIQKRRLRMKHLGLLKALTINANVAIT